MRRLNTNAANCADRCTAGVTTAQQHRPNKCQVHFSMCCYLRAASKTKRNDIVMKCALRTTSPCLCNALNQCLLCRHSQRQAGSRALLDRVSTQGRFGHRVCYKNIRIHMPHSSDMETCQKRPEPVWPRGNIA